MDLCSNPDRDSRDWKPGIQMATGASRILARQHHGRSQNSRCHVHKLRHQVRSPIASNPKNIFYKIRAISGRRKSRFEEPKGRCISPNRPGLIIYTSAKNNGPKVTYPMAIIIIFSPAKRVIIQRYGAYSHVQTTSEGAFLPT